MVAKKIAVVLAPLVLGLMILGCSQASGKKQISTPPRIPGILMKTPRGVEVFVPVWLNKESELRAAAFNEIDLALPTASLNLIVSTGVPRNIRVYIQDPGMYSYWGSPTGLAWGHTDIETYIYVSWTMKNTGPLMPAMAHELGHVYTKSPCAGHGIECGT